MRINPFESQLEKLARTLTEQFMKKDLGKQGLLNVVEDALIERRAMQRWPGVRRKLDIMFQPIRGRIVKFFEQRGPFDRFCTAVYLVLSHHKNLLGLNRELIGYEGLLDLSFSTISNSTANPMAFMPGWEYDFDVGT